MHLPPHPIPLGCPVALDLGALLHALNLHWSCILYIVIHMFQCYSFKASPHLTFSLRVQMSVLYICVSFAALHVVLSLLSF